MSKYDYKNLLNKNLGALAQWWTDKDGFDSIVNKNNCCSYKKIRINKNRNNFIFCVDLNACNTKHYSC